MNLSATPHNRASEHAIEIYRQVIEAVRADRLVSRAVQRAGDSLFIQQDRIDLSQFDRVWIAGVGKASCAMAQALDGILGDRLSGGLVITKTGHGIEVPKVTVIEAAHPVPDRTSLDAGVRMLSFAESVGERDLVFFLLSGGASALMEAPKDGIELADLQDVTRHYLASGVDIGTLNHIRSRLSDIKGGGLAKAFSHTTVVALVVSDVLGNDLRTIGSGPLVSPGLTGLKLGPTWVSSFQGPFRDKVNQALRTPAMLPGAVGHQIPHYVIGSVSLAMIEAADAARRLGLEPLSFADPLRGEARTMARKICRHAIDRLPPGACMIFGGETTVTIKGQGRGGRCQEMAVAAVDSMRSLPDTCFWAAGTDGTDGPTDAAGGFVDPDSAGRALGNGFRTRVSLRDNDSYAFLRACGGLIQTGPTGSNVNDIVLVVRSESI
ncbi:MAG: DUF4147 domain-containing protein [Fimbriimonas sp.]|nr:DUF4147 domain-containing protein [Fimbriimonas sp.]